LSGRHARCKNARFLVEELLCKWAVCTVRAVRRRRVARAREAQRPRYGCTARRRLQRARQRRLVHFRNSARIYYKDKRDLPRWVEISGQHVEVLTAILEDVPQRQKIRVGVSCRVEVCILGQHIHSASLLHAMSRVVDIRRLWGHPSESWFIQKVSNAPLNSFAIR